MASRVFYRTVITVEVLSEEPLTGNEGLSDIEYLINESCSGRVETIVENEKIDGLRMAQLLFEHASDPLDFGLDEEGNDLGGSEEEEKGREEA
jgi:hypothetical protein